MSFGLSLIERETPIKPWMQEYEFILVQTIDHLKELIDESIKAPYVAFDLESTGLDTRVFNGVPVNRVVGYSIAFEPKKCYYIPIRHKVETERGKNLPIKETNEQIQRLINEAVVVGHNWLKYDAEMMLASDGIVLKKFKAGEEITYHDSFVLARLAGKKPAGLKWLSKNLVGKEMIEIKEVVTNAKDVDFGSVSPYEGLVYAASDAICTKEIFEHPDIQAPITEQKFIYNLERKVLYVVRNMERNKIKLNVEFCKQLDLELIDKIEGLQKQAYKIVEEKTEGKIKEFKLDSPRDVSDILFNVFDMNPKPEKGKNGDYKTDDATLEKLASNYELAKVLQEYRTFTKFHRTYIKNMLNNVDRDGYLKFQFSSLQTDSGRFASPGGGKNGDGCSGVNIQAIPARYDKSKPNVRKCLACDDDEVFVAMDWAGVELRIATNLSLEPIWLDRFVNGDGDLHTSTASIIFDKPELEVEKQERQTGKTFNFQSVYGGGPGALASTLGITMDDAKEKQGKFFGRLKTLKQYIRSLQKFGQKNHYCLTKFGRRRPLPEYKSDFPKMHRNADRKATNTPIQGTAADLMKLAMVKMDEWIEDNGYQDIIKMVITMHDELCFRIKKEHVDKVKDLEEIMKLKPVLQKINWQVPLDVDVEVGDSWDIHYEYPDMLAYLKETYGADKVAYLYTSGLNYEEEIEKFNTWLKARKEAKKEAAEAAKEAESKITASDRSKEDFKKMGNSIVKSFEEKINKTEDNSKEEETLQVTKENFEEKLLESAQQALDHAEGKIELKEELIELKEPETKTIPALETVKMGIQESTAEKSVERHTASAEDLDSAFKVLHTAKLSDLPLEASQKLRRSFYEQEIERILGGYPSTEDEGVEIPIVVHSPIDEMKKSYMGVILDTCKGNGKIKFVSDDKQELHEGWFDADVLKASVMAKIFNL